MGLRIKMVTALRLIQNTPINDVYSTTWALEFLITHGQATTPLYSLTVKLDLARVTQWWATVRIKALCRWFVKISSIKQQP